MSEPTVSIILSSYNHANYIAEAIQSALDQTFTDFELLIFDDGSSDKSREIIKTFDDPRIKFFLYEENRGPRIILTEAVKNSRGKYIAIHHSDDAWEKNKLETQVDFLDAHEEYAACFTRVNFIDEKSNYHELADDDYYKKVFEQENRTRAEWLKYFFYNANCLCHPSLMIRHEIYEKYNLLDFFGLWQLPDYFMWIKLCFHENFYILPEKLTKFRLRRKTQDNMSASTFDKLVRAESEFFLIARNFLDEFTDDKFFLEVFPEAKKFVIGGEFNRNFAFAQICFGEARISYKLIGLEILKNLLSDEKTSAQIKKLYNYDEKTFLFDSGKFDVFNLAQKMSMIHSEIFLGDDEKNFNLAGEKFFYVDGEGNFIGKAEIFSEKPVKFLRFDPDNNVISVKLNSVKINGVEQKIFGINAGSISGGFYRFITADPQFIFQVDNLSGKIIFEVQGKREKNYPEILNREFNSLSSQNKNLQRKKSDLERQNSDLERHIEELERHIEELDKHILNLNKTVETLLNSNSWKITEPLRKFGDWMKKDKKDKALEIARAVYKVAPISEETKIGLKNKFYTSFAPFIKNTRHYRDWNDAQNPPQKPFDEISHSKFFVGELETQPGKIAIQAHIFYLDLLEEIAEYFSNMPYKFDALISIIDSSAREKVQETFEKIPNVEKCIVRVVPNRGRDVAPFIIGFGDILPNYNFIAHVHSKKSLYTGSEQKKWRHYLFDALLGDSARIKKIFKAFNDDRKVGLIYPAPAENVPYAAFTWLSNQKAGYYLLNKIGVPLNTTNYFDFPAGTMFWARSKALRKFFSSNLTIEDFPEERGQNDGTIAHAFERSVALTTLSEGMNFYEFNPENDSYTVNIGGRNMWQYFGHNETEIQWVLDHGEIISFDIFDTLLMRYVAEPYLVNELIKIKVEELLKRNFDFPKFRLQAEEDARKKLSRDVTLDDIYKSFSELTKFDEETCEKIRDLEISTEAELTLPREKVVDWFKQILSLNREIWLISDMYLQTPAIKELLSKCGIDGYEKIMISCEVGMRKDTAEIWDHLVEKGFTHGKLIHIGDNEMSDIQFPSDRIIFAYHVMSARNLFSQIPFGRNLLKHLGRKMSLYAGMMLGMILAKKFQSPFQLKNSSGHGGKLIIKNFRDLGYWFYGVPLLTFMLWLIKKSGEDKIRRLLFFARDGYFLQPLYKLVTELLNVEGLPSNYFYSSRRAVTVASIKNLEQANELVKLKFDGTTKKFFDVRFGLEIGGNEKISLPEKDSDVVKNIIEKNSAKILEHAKTERDNYLKYIESLGANLEEVGVVDMGYSGTIQYYLQRLTRKDFKGYYFATSDKNRFGKNSDEFLRGCFTENDDYETTRSSIYQYQLLFEAVLTAPDAQLNSFDAEGKPIFGEPEPGQNFIEEIREVHEGIKDFCRDVLNIFGEYILKTPIDFDFSDAWVKFFVQDENIISDDLKKIFSIDDEYCNTFNGNALDFYLKGLDRIGVIVRESDKKKS